jgi:hypothetical protein
MPAKKLRKKTRTSACAKDAEKARKICGFPCGKAAGKPRIYGGIAGEIPQVILWPNFLKPRIVKPVSLFSIHKMQRFFHLPLTSRSTERSFCRNLDNSARGGTNEGYEAIAFGYSFSATIRFLAVPRLPGHGQSEDSGSAAIKRRASFRRPINEPKTPQEVRVTNDSRYLLSFEEAPPSGALRAGEEEMS